jgi:hypothetical protein
MATEEQYAALATSFGLPLPQWLSALLQNYSLCGAELFWQAYPPEDDFDGRSYIVLADPGNMAAESTELTPGCDILPLGFVCIAADGDGIGDPYFIPLDKEDPPCLSGLSRQYCGGGPDRAALGKTSGPPSLRLSEHAHASVN